MKEIITLFLAIFYLNTLTGQEICDNAIDDDNDGKIDLNDTECYCQTPLEVSFIPNPSLEEKVCCPDSLGQMKCVEAWIQGLVGTTDYFNTCGITSLENGEFNDLTTIFPPFPPRPIPNGNGFAGFINGFTSKNNRYKEYLSVCLNQPLYKDSSYILEFFIGFGIKKENTYSSQSDFEISVFGISNCNKI